MHAFKNHVHRADLSLKSQDGFSHDPEEVKENSVNYHKVSIISYSLILFWVSVKKVKTFDKVRKN